MRLLYALLVYAVVGLGLTTVWALASQAQAEADLLRAQRAGVPLETKLAAARVAAIEAREADAATRPIHAAAADDFSGDSEPDCVR